MTDIIQRDFVHMLCKAEKVAVASKKPEDDARYDLLLVLYHDAKQIRTLATFTMSEFLQWAYAIGASYENKVSNTLAKCHAESIYVPSLSGNVTAQQRRGARDSRWDHITTKRQAQDHDKKGRF